jgi:hypothetical protein
MQSVAKILITYPCKFMLQIIDKQLTVQIILLTSEISRNCKIIVFLKFKASLCVFVGGGGINAILYYSIVPRRLYFPALQ